MTEVEAPPTEVINHILNERHLWDDHLLKSRVVERLDSDTDVFQYVCGQPITDYCVLRYNISAIILNVYYIIPTYSTDNGINSKPVALASSSRFLFLIMVLNYCWVEYEASFWHPDTSSNPAVVANAN